MMRVATLGVGAAFGADGGHSAKRTGIFSNLTYVEQTGDLIGMELSIVNGASSPVALVQCAGDVMEDPLLAKVEPTGAHVRFTLPHPLGDCGSEFEGTVSAKGIRGRFAGEAEERWLPRKTSYWE